MNTNDDTLLEQLSAWMDGELPPDQARFLQRRLESDPGLRQRWDHWQLASACLRGQRVAPMPATLAPAIAAEVAREPRRRGAWPWLATAAALALVAVLLPSRPGVAPVPAGIVGAPTAMPAPAGVNPVVDAPLAATAAPAAIVAAPVPVDAPSAPTVPIAQLPLADTGAKPWPRSPRAADAGELEAYLVGHNTLMAEDGLGGFMPYVDVVANGADTAGSLDGDGELAAAIEAARAAQQARAGDRGR